MQIQMQKDQTCFVKVPLTEAAHQHLVKLPLTEAAHLLQKHVVLALDYSVEIMVVLAAAVPLMTRLLLVVVP